MQSKLENILKKVKNAISGPSKESGRKITTIKEEENYIIKKQDRSNNGFNDAIFIDNDSYINYPKNDNLSKSDYEPPKKTSDIYEKPFYAPPLKAEDVLIDIFMIDPCLTELQLGKYINIVLSNTGNYILLMLANNTFDSMPLFCNTALARKENEKLIKSFLASNRVKENTFNLANVVTTINLRSKDISIPNMITMQQAKLEEEEYKKERYLSTISKKEEKADDKNVSDSLENWPVVGLDYDMKQPERKIENVPAPNETLKKEEQKEEEKPKKANIYFPWSFKPSKPIYNTIINSISIIGSSYISIDKYDIKDFNEARRVIENFRNKTTDFVFYSLNDENIETLSAFGFRKIELLYDKFV